MGSYARPLGRGTSVWQPLPIKRPSAARGGRRHRQRAAISTADPTWSLMGQWVAPKAGGVLFCLGLQVVAQDMGMPRGVRTP